MPRLPMIPFVPFLSCPTLSLVYRNTSDKEVCYVVFFLTLATPEVLNSKEVLSRLMNAIPDTKKAYPTVVAVLGSALIHFH
jgi:hypothetical protein